MPQRSAVDQIAWEDQYKIGVAAIDRDHEALFRIYNEIVLTLAHSSDARISERTIEALGRYAKTHFVVEEELMSAIGYPKYMEHKAIHQSFSDYVEDLAMAYANGEETSPDFIEFLGTWILSHILGMDLQIAEYLRAIGTKVERAE